MSKASQHQPNPTKGHKKVLDLVLTDLEERAEAGNERYGTYLETHNGRDALWDLYQELLDSCMYVRQLIEERKPNPRKKTVFPTYKKTPCHVCGKDIAHNWYIRHLKSDCKIG